MAVAFDTICQGLIGLILALALAIASVGLSAAAKWSSVWIVALFIISYFLLFWGYFAFFEIIWHGQTPGKRQAKIRVIRENGQAIGVYEALLRNLVRVVDLMPGIYAIGVVSIAVSWQNKRLGDYAAGTVVVHDSSAEDVAPSSLELSSASTAAGYQVSALTIEDLQLIETFLQRRFDLPYEVRSDTAKRIAARVRTKLGVEADDSDVETFLIDVARAKRSMGSK